MELSVILSVARHGLQFLGGLMVMHGVMEETAIEFLVGGGVNILALAWFWWSAKKSEKGSVDGNTKAH